MKMETDIQTDAVQAMQDYIEAHVSGTITPGALARITGYSPWYASRLFQQFLNMTPADYIRRLKLSKSAVRLRDEKVRVLDAALDAGFESAEGYQRAFFREFGCNPREYALNPVPIYLFYPFGVKYKRPDRENSMDDVKTVFVQAVEKPVRKVLIKRDVKATDYFAYCDEVGCDVWGLLLSMKSLCGEPVCLWLPAKYRKPGTSEYVQGVEVAADYDGAVPGGFDVIQLPASTYLMFRGEPFKEEAFCEAIEQVWNAVKKYDPSVTGYAWDETNPRIQLEPRGSRGYVELLPVKKL
jgi:AraC-type DNA-binding domain-containing proteins